jgi:NADH-quinone oxidoreductase subunit A
LRGKLRAEERVEKAMLELYAPMFIMFAIVAVICTVMFAGGHFVGPKNPTPEKVMPFECGNDTPGARDVKMNVKFYLTAILFVVFDVEVVFMYPWATLFKSLGWFGFLSMFSFIVALIVALAYCWKKGALEWES